MGERYGECGGDQVNREFATRSGARTLRIGDLIVSRKYVYVIVGHFRTTWDPYDTGGREIPVGLCIAMGFCKRQGLRVAAWETSTVAEALKSADRVFR